MLPSIGLVLSVEMLRDGGSLAAIFQGSNGAEYWLLFELQTRELPSGHLERTGYKDPVVVERQVGLPIGVSWQQATIMLHQMRGLVTDASSLKWLETMELAAVGRGQLPANLERTLEAPKV
jgi:hypothetical protein